MDQYIQQLLSQQTRVIVPGLGAIITSAESGMMFNQFLNFDDNSLVKFVAEQENISEDEARQRVTDYVNNVKQRLDAGEDVAINDVCTIKKEGESYNITASDNFTAAASPIDFSTPDSGVAAGENEENVTVVVQNNDEKKSRKTLLIILLIALIFLISVILCLFVINKDNCVYNFFFGDGEKTEQVEPVVEQPAVEEPDTTAVAPAEPAEMTRSGKRYNIIVGTYFKNEKAAQARVDALKEKGFENAFVSTFRNNYVAVIDSYDRLPEAEARQEYIVDTYRIESFISNSGE